MAVWKPETCDEMFREYISRVGSLYEGYCWESVGDFHSYTQAEEHCGVMSKAVRLPTVEPIRTQG